MPRPPLNFILVLEIYRLRQAGLSIDKILDELSDAEGRGKLPYKVPARRTVANYTKRYDDLPDDVKELDNPFQWHRLESYGLPGESSASLLEALFYFKEQFPFGTTVFSARRALWSWRVHLAAPELNIDDVLFLAERFIVREKLRDLLNISVTMGDLDSHLAYRPWLSESRRNIYKQAIDDGRVQPLQFRGDYQEGQKAINQTEHGKDIYYYLLPADEHTGETTHDLVYSQHWAIIHSRNDGDSMAEALKYALEIYSDWDVSPT